MTDYEMLLKLVTEGKLQPSGVLYQGEFFNIECGAGILHLNGVEMDVPEYFVRDLDDAMLKTAEICHIKQLLGIKMTNWKGRAKEEAEKAKHSQEVRNRIKILLKMPK